MTNDTLYQPRQSWLKLGEGFSDPVQSAPFPKKILRYRNQKAAEALGLDDLSDSQWLEHFADFKALPNNLPEPLALRYHGHQFTHYNPDLGDGRGFLFAQVQDPKTSCLLDLGTKGSGQTPYSRKGDGRLTLKGAVRELLATTYLESKGVNTSKTFSIVETGEDLIRHDEPSPTRSAVLVRLSHSHVRFGTFQRLAFHKEKQKMMSLLDYCLSELYPNTKRENFFEAVCRNVAHTTAQWMIHGFVHGVLNTDNMNITGESFDYGPYRFLPHYDPQFTAAYFDHNSLYAYGQQPAMVLWNLERLQEALSLVITDPSFFQRGFDLFKTEFTCKTIDLFAHKIGISQENPSEKIQNLFYLCLQFLEKSKAPYEAFFHHLYLWHQDLSRPLPTYDPLYLGSEIEKIEKELGQLTRSPLAVEKKDPQPETLLIDEIESLWAAIDKSDDWDPLQKKILRLS